jgi:hypothetical protein
MELKDANNKSYRSRKASQHGENKVENQEGERWERTLLPPEAIRTRIYPIIIDEMPEVATDPI